MFLGFLAIALSGFGGTLAFARRTIVERRHWLTDREFTDTLSLCQFLPGPNVANVSISVGARFHGVMGAAAAFLGLTAAPFCLVILLGALYGRFGQVEVIKGALNGVSASAAGLMVAMGLQMAAAFRRSAEAVIFILLAFIAVGLLGWPILWVLAALMPLSIAVAWRRL